jgi:hypothetical protein
MQVVNMIKKNLKVIVIFMILIKSGMVHSRDGEYIGKIGSVNVPGKEIIINIKNNKVLETGSCVYTRIGNDIVLIETTFVMMTTSKCKMARGSEKFLRKLEKGMDVWRYDKALLEVMVSEEEQIPLPQDREAVLSEQSLTWLGIDYTLAKFSFIDENPAIVKDSFSAINKAVINDEDKYNIRKFFNKKTVIFDQAIINSSNGKIDPEKIKIGSSYTVELNAVRKLISSYNTKGKQGMGLVFVAENMNKSQKTGSYYVCFIDLGTKKIIDSTRVVGKAGGAGIINYWARSVLDGMKRWKAGN